MTSKTRSRERSGVSFGTVLQKYRMRMELSQPRLAELLGTSRNTITNWENDRSLPTADAIGELVRILGIPLGELFGLPDEAELLSSHETQLLSQYRRLSPGGKRVTDKLVDALLTEEQMLHERELRENYFLLPLEATPAAAGSGCDFVDVAPEYRFIKRNSFNGAADALIRVSGASMEPLYHNGDMVYLRYGNSAEDGQDVVCSTADGAVIKRVSGRKLYSLNEELPFGEKAEDDHVRILGVVLGIVGAEELPDEEDTLALEEIKHKEIQEFNRMHGGE